MGSRGERRGGQASRPEVDGMRAAKSREEPERSVLEAAAPEGGLAAAAFPAPDPRDYAALLRNSSLARTTAGAKSRESRRTRREDLMRGHLLTILEPVRATEFSSTPSGLSSPLPG